MNNNKFISNLFFSILFTITSAPILAKPSIEDYGSLRTVSMMTISPSGKSIAFRQNSDNFDLVVVYSLEQNKVLTRTDISEVKPQHMYFIDEKRIIIRASQEKHMREYRKKFLDISTAFLYDINTGEISQLLRPGDVIYKGQNGLGKIISLDKKKEFAFMPAFVGQSSSDNNPDLSLLKVDLNSPKHPKVIEKGKNYTIDYFTGENGQAIVRVDYNNRSNMHSVLVKKKKKWIPIYQHETEFDRVGIVGLTPNRKSLVVITTDKSSNYNDYFTMSLETGNLLATDFGREDRDIEHVYDNINRIVFGVKYSGFTPSYNFFDKKLDARMQKIVAQFPEQAVHLTDWSEDWKDLIVYIAGSSYAGEYYLFKEGKDPVFLASAYSNIKSEDINPIGSATLKARDDLPIPTLLTVPQELVASLKNMPAIMLPHGGPQSYDSIGFDWLAQALASEGYLVIQPQFRGSDGFGKKHRVAGHGEWGKKMQDDLTDVLASLIRQGMVDPKRVCIVGASYGGYAALAGATFTPDLYKCAVSISGVSDIPLMMSTEKSEHGKDHWVLSYWEQVIADGNGDKAFLESISPTNFVEAVQVPVLLLHGDKDKVVPFAQSKVIYKKLKKANKNVQLVKLEGEDHHLSNRETRIQTLKSLSAFLNKHL